MIQRPPLLILSGTSLHRLYNITYECCHSMSSLWYNFALYLLSDTSQHPVAMIQSPPCFFSFLYVTLRRHYKQIYSKPSQWYTVIRFKRHMFVFFLLPRSNAVTLIQRKKKNSYTSQYAVNVKQRHRCAFYLVSHSSTSLWNKVHFVSSFRYVIVGCNHDTTPALFCFIFWYVTLRRHNDTTSALLLLSGKSQYAVTMIQGPPCFMVTALIDCEITLEPVSGTNQYWAMNVKFRDIQLSTALSIRALQQYFYILILDDFFKQKEPFA